MSQRSRQKKAFLTAFAEYGNITTAARAAGVHRRMIYRWQEHDDDFAAAFREAELEATEVMEAEARRRAVDGVTHETPLLFNGRVVDTVVETKYSDTLLIFLLKARAPEKYRERSEVRHGGTVQHEHRLDLSKLDDEELAILERLVGRAAPQRD